MSVVDFAETLRQLMEDKINRYRKDMHDSNSRAETDKLMIKIQALEWVQAQIQDLVINK